MIPFHSGKKLEESILSVDFVSQQTSNFGYGHTRPRAGYFLANSQLDWVGGGVHCCGFVDADINKRRGVDVSLCVVVVVVFFFSAFLTQIDEFHQGTLFYANLHQNILGALWPESDESESRRSWEPSSNNQVKSGGSFCCTFLLILLGRFLEQALGKKWVWNLEAQCLCE